VDEEEVVLDQVMLELWQWQGTCSQLVQEGMMCVLMPWFFDAGVIEDVGDKVAAVR
jgi:hypothetical protein